MKSQGVGLNNPVGDGFNEILFILMYQAKNLEGIDFGGKGKDKKPTLIHIKV